MGVEYFAPTGLEDALALLAARPMRVIAGGTDLYPAQGRAPWRTDLLDINRIDCLVGIELEPEGLRIGAATTWTDLARADLPPAFDGLRAAALQVGGVQIQNAGTIGGNICNASPAADGVPPLLSLDAEVEIAEGAERYRTPLSEFLTGPRNTTLPEGALVTAIYVPPQPANAKSAFEKLGARRYLVISIASVAVVIGLDEDNLIYHARISVGACSPVPQRLPGLEQDVLGQHPESVIVREDHLGPIAPISDVRAESGYRREVVAELILRAIQRAAHG